MATTNKDPFEALGVSREAALAALEETRTRRIGDSRVCICGHPVGRHAVSEVTGKTSCRPTRMDCPCPVIEPVVEVEDVRPFLHKTKGHGFKHALMLGFAALEKKGKSFEWIEEAGWPRCEMARTETECAGGKLPYAVRGGRLSREPADRNVLLCEAHFEEARVAGVPL